MGFILVFDLTNEQSFMHIRNWLVQIETHAYTDKPDVILCGNKSDLEESRVITEKRAKELASEYGYGYMVIWLYGYMVIWVWVYGMGIWV